MPCGNACEQHKRHAERNAPDLDFAEIHTSGDDYCIQHYNMRYRVSCSE